MSIVLNGSTQYAYILEALTAGRPVIIAGWFKSDSDSAAQAIASLADKDSDVDYRVLGLRGDLGGDPVIAQERDTDDIGEAQTSTGYTIGVWHHAIAEFIATSSRKVLIDGSNEGTNSVVVIAENLDKTAIGVICRNTLAWFFDGKLAEIAMWDATLNDQQKADLANGVKPSSIDPTNLLAYWSLRENANDGSGNNKHLTIVGSPSFDTEDHPEMGNLVGSSDTTFAVSGSLDTQPRCYSEAVTGVSGANGVLSVPDLVSFITEVSGAVGELIINCVELSGGLIADTSSLSGAIRIHNYLSDEQSAIYGQPVELYLFNRDNIEYWSYTSSDSIIVFNGRSYIPVLIRRGDIALDLNSLKTRIEIETDLSNPFARNFIDEPLEGKISLTIYRRHLNSFITYWKGYVQGVKFKSKTAVILSGLKNASLKRSGLMRKYQRNCGLPLYSIWCGILKTNSLYYIDGTINSVDGRTIDATIFGTKVTDWLLGGILKTDDGSCLQKIVYHVGNEIKIARAVSALKAGDTFRAWAGCDHLKSTCDTKFENKLNYGGQPHLPDKNPFAGDAVM